MGNVGTAGGSDGRSGSSAAAFVKQINDAIAARVSLPRHRDGVNAWEEWRVLQPGQSTAELFMLPSRKAADNVMEIYWNRIHNLYPFLCRPRFILVYESLWSGENEQITESANYCLLYSIFALSCQVSKKSKGDEKDAASHYHARRAIQLLQVNVIGTGSMELVQALLYMALYMQSTESPNTCWVVTGLAIRISQSLGLHLPGTSSSQVHQQDRELSRRLWHGCVFIDRYVILYQVL